MKKWLIRQSKLFICFLVGHNWERIYNNPESKLDKLIECNFYWRCERCGKKWYHYYDNLKEEQQ